MTEHGPYTKKTALPCAMLSVSVPQDSAKAGILGNECVRHTNAVCESHV